MTDMTCLVDLVTREWIMDSSHAADGVRYVREVVPRTPDPRTEKRGAAPGTFALKTQAEIDEYDERPHLREAAIRARLLDRATDIALMIRYHDPAAWTAMPTAAKKTAVQAEMTRWEVMREFMRKQVRP